MARRIYTDMDRAKAAAMLQMNEGNVKRTARELGFPVITVREWKVKWERDGYPEAIEEAIPVARELALEDFKRVVQLATDQVIAELEKGNVKAKDAAWIAGLYTDKIRLALGQPTSRTETVQVLPDTAELAKELASYVGQVVEDAKLRDAEIEDAMWVDNKEQAKALPALLA